jgi:hypothetical protein
MNLKNCAIVVLLLSLPRGGYPQARSELRTSVVKNLEAGAAQAALGLIETAVAHGGEASLEDGLTPSLFHYAGIASQMLGDLSSAVAGYRKALEVLFEEQLSLA